MNLTGKLNLMQLKNACIVSVKGNTATKQGVFIPIEDNDLFVPKDETGAPKGAYLDINIWENRQPGRYGDTHAVRPSISKKAREAMGEEQYREAIKALPYIGNLRPLEFGGHSAAQQAAPAADAPAITPTNPEEDDGLPF